MDPSRQRGRMPFLINPYLEMANDVAGLYAIEDMPIQDNDLFLGCAGFPALTILSMAGSQFNQVFKQAVLFDSNIYQQKAMKAVLLHIRDSDTMEECQRRIAETILPLFIHRPHEDTKHLTPEDEKYFATVASRSQPYSKKGTEQELERESWENAVWLKHPVLFDRLKSLVENSRIEIANIDIVTDRDRVERLSDWMAAEGYQCRLFYATSMLDFYQDLPLAPEGSNRYKRERADFYGMEYEGVGPKHVIETINKLADSRTAFLVSKSMDEPGHHVLVLAKKSHMLDHFRKLTCPETGKLLYMDTTLVDVRGNGIAINKLNVIDPSHPPQKERPISVMSIQFMNGNPTPQELMHISKALAAYDYTISPADNHEYRAEGPSARSASFAEEVRMLQGAITQGLERAKSPTQRDAWKSRDIS